MVPGLPGLWSGFTDPGTKGLASGSNLFSPSHFFEKCLDDNGVFELSEAHGIALSKGLYLRHRETLCIDILLIELKKNLYNWHNCVFDLRIGSLITRSE